MEMKREHQINFWYFVAALFGMLLIQQFLFQPSHLKTIPYSEFQQLVDQGKVADVVVSDTQITGTLKDAKSGDPQHFATARVPADIASTLSKTGISFSGEAPPSLIQNLLGWLLPAVGFIFLWMFLIRPMAGQGMGGMGSMMSIGKSKAKIYAEKDIKVSFADVAGLDEAKVELMELVSFLKDPKGYGRLGAHVPKGVLLVGPPGTGKTLLARAIAGEAGVTFFSISGSEFVEMFVGVGAARVRDLFEQARKHAPAIVFIDELDALGAARGSSLPGMGGHDEKEQTLNQLLNELDGFDPSIGVILLGATNRPEVLDPALLRPGRFDRQILVDRPDKKGRSDILAIYLGKITLADGVSADDIAALTPGFTGADLANLVNEAALVATRRGGENVILEDFNVAIERIVAGLEKRNRLLNPYEREVVARHEMGHALAAMALPGVDPVHKVSIIPHGIAALGFTMQRPTEDRFLMNRAELFNRMVVLLGGRAAESLFYDDVSTGAADDLVKVTEIARSMVVRFGMDPKLGLVTYETVAAPLLGGASGLDWRPRQYGEETATAIDQAVRELIDAAFRAAVEILARNRELLDRAASQLLVKETFGAVELREIAAQIKAGVPTTHLSPREVVNTAVADRPAA